ncbi:peptide ABC transporter permease, partial [Streptococcus suis]
GTDDAVRVFSKTKDISTFELVSGRFAKTSSEIVLSAQLKGTYKIGDTITFSQGKTKSLKKNTFTVVGFANSSEILSTTSLGSSTAGDGLLSSYAIVAP